MLLNRIVKIYKDLLFSVMVKLSTLFLFMQINNFNFYLKKVSLYIK